MKNVKPRKPIHKRETLSDFEYNLKKLAKESLEKLKSLKK